MSGEWAKKTDEQKQRSKEAHKRYRDKNRKALNEQNKRHYAENRDQIANRKKALREADLDNRLEKEQEYRDRNRDRINALMNSRRRTAKLKCLGFLGGPKCSVCGFESSHGCQFDLHHEDPTTKSFSISKRISNGALFEAVKDEVAKCTVVCRNCHALIHSSGG